jgi:mono/diheme cytochrome c family protein
MRSTWGALIVMSAALWSPWVSASERLYSPAQANAGARLYAVNCSRCHGSELQGGSAPPLRGPKIANRWPVRLLYHFVSHEMPADARGRLSDRSYRAIVAFLLARNGHAAGTSELTAAAASTIATKL